MEKNNHILNHHKPKKLIKSNKTISSFDDANKRRKSSPNILNNHFLKNKENKITKNTQIKSSIHSSKNNKLRKNLFLENKNNDEIDNSIFDFNSKKKKSIIYTEHLLKHKIEEDLSFHLNNNNINDNINKENNIKLNISKNSDKEISFNNKNTKSTKKRKKYINNDKKKGL